MYFFIGCDSYKEPLYMHGFVYDNIKKEPIQQIKVKMLIDNQEVFSITDEKGYFKINKFSVGDLHFLFKEQNICSVRTGGVQKWSGKFVYNFAEGKNDTLFIDMSKYER